MPIRPLHAALIWCLVASTGQAQGARAPLIGFHYGVPLKWSAVVAYPLTDVKASATFIAVQPGIGDWSAGVGHIRFTTSEAAMCCAPPSCTPANARGVRRATDRSWEVNFSSCRCLRAA